MLIMSFITNFLDARPQHNAGRASVLVTNWHIFFNITGCIVAGYIYFYILLYSERPLTLDVIFFIFQAELCRWANARRRKHPDLQEVADDPGALEKGRSGGQMLDSIAAIVGYREDSALFTRALESYRCASNCKFILVSIDGDEMEDQEMINVFRNVSTSLPSQ